MDISTLIVTTIIAVRWIRRTCIAATLRSSRQSTTSNRREAYTRTFLGALHGAPLSFVHISSWNGIRF